MLYRIVNMIAFCLIGISATAQELNCKVTVLHEKITGVDNQVFTNMQRAISDFINTRKWTTDDFTVSEKIDCSFLINLTSRVAGDNDGYNATISIQATRPVYNSDYQTPMVNYVDKDVIFHYSPFTPIQFDDNRISGSDPLASNLTAILAYYVYLIIALDYDSFAPMGGTVYLKKAQNIVNNAPEQGKTISGWKAVDGTRNRYYLVDQLQNNRFEEVRKYWYSMHREGLDNLFTKPVEGRQKILAGIQRLYGVNKENPSSILLQFFFNAKSDEYVKIISQIPAPDRVPFITLLSQMDVPNAGKYNNLK